MIYLSICIPTKNRVDYLKEVIESIKSDSVDVNLYQIVVSDNSDNSDTEEYCKIEKNKGVNIKYFRNPKSGFYNSIQSLKLGDGEFLKLHNDYSKFKKGMFKKLVSCVENNIKDKPTIFFSNGSLSQKEEKRRCQTLNSFVKNASYLITWSSAFSIWRDDLYKVDHMESDVDTMFPHTSLLLKMSDKNFLICNEEIIENIHVKNKGGYNIFYNFCILFLNMVKNNVNIERKTYLKVKRDLYYKFIIVWYYRSVIEKERYTFDNHNAFGYIKDTYGLGYAFFASFLSYARLLKKKFDKLL